MRGTFIANQVARGIDTDCLKYSLISPIRSEKSLQISMKPSYSICVEPQESITKRNAERRVACDMQRCKLITGNAKGTKSCHVKRVDK